MAAEIRRRLILEQSRKRQRLTHAPKLLPNEQVEVIVPKGSLCQLNVKTNVGLPPDAIYNIVTDPDNRRVFKNIQEVISRKVLLDEGSRQVVELEQAAIWRFLWWSGTIAVHVLVDQNRDDYSMKFKQVKPGFMKRFEGSWKVEPILLDEKLCHPFKPKNYVILSNRRHLIHRATSETRSTESLGSLLVFCKRFLSVTC